MSDGAVSEPTRPRDRAPHSLEQMIEFDRRERATIYPITLSYDEYCALIAAHSILFDFVCGIRYTERLHKARVRVGVVDVLRDMTRRAEQSKVPSAE